MLHWPKIARLEFLEQWEEFGVHQIGTALPFWLGTEAGKAAFRGAAHWGGPLELKQNRALQTVIN